MFSFEGLYALGNGDAYSIRPYEGARLHNHVERTKDECWRLHVTRVVNPRHKLLGWSLCVVFFPTLSSEATEDEIGAAEIAQILELKHLRTYGEAVIAVNGTQHFMLEEGRVNEPDYAFMNDFEVFELMSVQSSGEHKIGPEWNMLEGSCVRAFLNGRQSLVRTLEHWHPRQEDTIAQVAEALGLPLHTADQLYIRMLESMKISEPWEIDDTPR